MYSLMSCQLITAHILWIWGGKLGHFTQLVWHCMAFLLRA